MRIRVMAGLLALGLVAGCGSAADRGKNKDKDVPKADVDVRPLKDQPKAAPEPPAPAKEEPKAAVEKAGPKQPEAGKPPTDTKSVPKEK